MASSSCVVTESESHRVAGPERVITELNRGREIADRLRRMLREVSFDGSVLPAQSLVTQLLDTFNHSLTMLRADSFDEDGAVSQLPRDIKPEEEYSGDSCKKPVAKDRRGCYKRKRSSETWTKETQNLFEDGHAWRKYGQKVILNAKHPRNYFRCTHKFEQGCQASKQVQKIGDEPPLFRTTYHGQHTCINKSTHLNILEQDPEYSSVMWTFDNNSINKHKEEEEEEEENEQIIKRSSGNYNYDDQYLISTGSDMPSDVYSCSAASTPSIHHDIDAIVDFQYFWN